MWYKSTMKADQWVFLYEKERATRLQAENEVSNLEDDIIHVYNEYLNLLFYLESGRVPLIVELNNMTSVYLIS
jgi:hypothetical protein